MVEHRFGRKKIFYICLLIQLGSSLGLLGMSEYIGFTVLMFVIGAATLGVYMTSYVIGIVKYVQHLICFIP